MKSFDEQLLIEILRNIDNFYTDNHDFYRFKEEPNFAAKLKSRLKSLSSKYFGFKISFLKSSEYQRSLDSLLPYMDGIRQLYYLLEDERSKALLTKLIAYRILGKEKIKLPLSTPEFWKGRVEIDKIKHKNDFIKATFGENSSICLYKFNLNQLNIPIEIYYRTAGMHNYLHIKQYEYNKNGIKIKPEDGEVVLDCGACWGDTALFFSNEVGTNGHVYSFEFIPGNINIFETNINLNPKLKQRITLVPFPIADTTGQELFYIDTGPASKVTNRQEHNLPKAQTISIDDFCLKNGIRRVDFIKMDIEGAELPALKGATNTIKKYKPKLAISLYHSMDDFVNIPEYLESLKIGYSFYLNHGTIHAEETVLMAIANNS